MSNWIIKNNNGCEEETIQHIVDQDTTELMEGDSIYVYKHSHSEGEFHLICKYSLDADIKLSAENFSSKVVDLPYRVLYETKTGDKLVRLDDNEINFILQKEIEDDKSLEVFENFLTKLEVQADLTPKNISENIVFNIGQPNTGKSYDFEESILFDLPAVEGKYRYLKIPVSGGIGNEYKGLQNTDLAITYDPIKKELRFGEFLQMLMSAIANPKVPHVVFLDDFHNQDISSLLSEYTPLFKKQQKRPIQDIDPTSSIYNREFENVDDFIEQWNNFISAHCNNIPAVPLTNRISGSSLKLVYPDNFYLLGAANFNENSLNIFADWEDRASITYVDPIKKFKESFTLPGNVDEDTKSFYNCCMAMNSVLKEILESDKKIFNYERYCFGMWKIVDSKSTIITDTDEHEKIINFFFGMIKNSLKFNNKTSEINEIGKKLIENLQQLEDPWFKDKIENAPDINEKILHSHNIYEDEI